MLYTSLLLRLKMGSTKTLSLIAFLSLFLHKIFISPKGDLKAEKSNEPWLNVEWDFKHPKEFCKISVVIKNKSLRHFPLSFSVTRRIPWVLRSLRNHKEFRISFFLSISLSLASDISQLVFSFCYLQWLFAYIYQYCYCWKIRK